jgi:cell division septation protein DedD
MLVQGPAPDSGVSDVPLAMPDTPRGAFETRDLPLVTPGTAPDGGAVGMGASSSGSATAPTASTPVPIADSGDAATAASQPLPTDADAPTASEPLPPSANAGPEMFPAATAGGDYVVGFGTFASASAADAVVGPLRTSRLPGYREQITLNGQPAWRVRIGPFESRADAEAARLRATRVRNDLDAKVVTLDAPVATAAATPKPTTPATKSRAAVPTPAAPVPSKPAANTPSPAAVAAAPAVGFAVQLAAFTKAADATALRDKVRTAGFSAFTESVSTDHGILTRVRAGPVQSRAEADQLKAQVKAKLGLDGVVRPHP